MMLPRTYWISSAFCSLIAPSVRESTIDTIAREDVEPAAAAIAAS